MKGKLFLAVVVCLFLIVTTPAQNTFRLDETATKAFIVGDKLKTELVFENKAAKFSAKIRLEILDADDRILARAETLETIKRGRQILTVWLPFSYSENSGGYLWQRLRYSVTPIENAGNPTLDGIVSLSEIMPEIFEIRAVAGERIYSGMNYRVRVRAFQPVTDAPMRDVEIAGELELDEVNKSDELKLTATGKTDKNGTAILNFKIPPEMNLDDGDVKITGAKNGITREAEKDLYPSETEYAVYLNTDKPLYQPNQKMSVRGLFLRKGDTDSATKALAEKELEFTIKDEDDTILYRETVKTSRFGIASISWQIPENAKLGTYRVTIDADKDLSSDQIYFKVSRYDLPNFAVNAKPDKTFYLPNETTAEISVGADYLFGKPVAKGKVKVVREKNREWNYKEQKWTVDEEKTYEGETDESGKFMVKVDLTEAHTALKDEQYKRFEDVRWAAYFTDATTNRTESRRFDVRVTKEAIHVYIVGIKSYDDQNPKLPIKFYVSTFYADGAPAVCAVEIKGKYEDEEKFQTLTEIKTNDFGAGKVAFAAPKRAAETYFDDLQITVHAFDTNGRTGIQEEEISIDEDEKAIQISTDKIIYRPGEPLKIRIVSTETDRDVDVDIIQNFAIISSRRVRLQNGRAEIKIPYRTEFKNYLTVGASIDDRDKTIETSRGVFYPRPTNLRLDAEPVQTTYRPNEEAKINFTVSTADKKSAETALGVIVFDKAIEERARADAAFGGSNVNQFGGYSQLLDGDLNRIDVTKPIAENLQTRMELVYSDSQFSPSFFGSREYETNLKSVFAKHFDRQFLPVEVVLKNAYAADFTPPADGVSLRKILSANAIDFDGLRDPWENSYRVNFTTEKDENFVSVESAGANKTFGNGDDVVVLQMKFKYFTRLGQAIDRAVSDFHARTNSFIRDYAALKNELQKQNIDLDAWRDRWNQPYKIEFGISGRFYTIDFKSGGRDGKFDDSYDDFTIWTNKIDFFAATENRLQAVLTNYANERKTFPKDNVDFIMLLKNEGINYDDLRDGWNRPFSLEFSVSSRYTDKIKTESVARYGESAQSKMTLTPVTQQVAFFRLKSAGADGVLDNGDDATYATFAGIVSEQGKSDAQPVTLKTETIFTGGKGAILGTIADLNGAVVPNAAVTGTNEQTSQIFEARSDEDGVYLLRNLPSGKYSVKIESAGFSTSIVNNVPVHSLNLTELNFTLSVGGVQSVVEVTADIVVVNATSSAISQNQIEELRINGRRFSSFLVTKSKNENGKTATVIEENSTPRLREYFPETLVWQPELITDKNGKAELKFKLGDNITTWKMYAIASNAEGKIGVAEREIKAFQPFFADLEPPKFLTVGDEISLPVPIRNYTAKAQKVDVTMAGGDWFNFTGAATRQMTVAPNDSQNAIFDFRADNIIKDGKQRVSAIAGRDSDAIEKSVTVKPNGKEIVGTKSEIFRDSAAFDVNFPANALPNTHQAELKIYPNLLAHVAESIEGLLQRPYGCGEQTISSTYPNLMILKFAPKNGKLYAPAENYLQKGYERLLGYQTADGGFAVWTKDAPDIALTAYALRFLTDAKMYIEVDDDAIKNARNWLIKQQRADGSWTRKYDWEKTEDSQRTKLMTTYAARTLAMTAKNIEAAKAENQSLQAALNYLKTRGGEIDEPYALALFGLALLDAGNFEDAKAIAAKLETMAIAENAGVYWNLETNTPFYGWGTAGRIETTALVVQLLVRVESGESGVESSKFGDLISKGTQFLLKNKDRYGVWHSTQTTVNVLDALLAAIGDGADKNVAEIRTAAVFINNQKLKDVALPPENALTFPINVELPTNRNDNRVEIKIGGNKSAVMAQIVQTHYVGWRDFEANGRDKNGSRALRLEYECDKQTARPTEEISCNVEAERIGFKGYGMLLAEIGLPPGADVDRASLEKAKEENWNFSRYDVSPDRIIVYLWAQAGGAKFNFKFKPRYGINAQTAPSIVYDYYNPEAQATVAPLKFTVR
ncbi:MAG: carboxypeptidase regulatory-like domain-containing protein [Pyrinomonadaceae bacterium]|nr:carboxypeptidase regulatory-like domain-containing protein [Pyrinomonadaceae bacterium]